MRKVWKKILEIFKLIINAIKIAIKWCFSSYPHLLALIGGLVLTIITIALLIFRIGHNSFYVNNSDDFIQYVSIMDEFILRIKSGTLSLFSHNNYLGSSVFGDVYYVPLDIFTLNCFLLSFFTRIEYAFSLTEMTKILLGVIAFSFYLYKRGRNTKSIFITSMLYMICGTTTIFMVFPCYLSIVFYAPLSAIVAYYFIHNKYKWSVPLLASILVLYNFYLAYTLLIFTMVIFVINYVTDKKIKGKLFGRFVLEVFEIGMLLVLGVIMTSFILIPSAAYIVEYSSRGGEMFSDFADFFSFINKIDGKAYYDQYFRIIAHIFTPSISTSFYGFQNSYVKEHLSSYITVSGLLIALQVFYINKREANVYKIFIPLFFIFCFIPIISMIFCGTSEPYTRWYFMITFILLLATSYVIDETNLDFYKARHFLVIRNTIIILIIGVCFYYYFNRLYGVNIIEGFKDLLAIKGGKDLWQPDQLEVDIVFLVVAMGLIIVLSIAPYVRKFSLFYITLFVEFIIGICFSFNVPFRQNNLVNTINIRQTTNDFLNENLPYDGTFKRIRVLDEVGFGIKEDFNRTQLQLTNTYTFHSFYNNRPAVYSKLIYDSTGMNTRKRDNDYGLIYNDAYLGYQYIVCKGYEEYYIEDNGTNTLVKTYVGMPSYYSLENSIDDQFLIYKTGNSPFVIFNTTEDFENNPTMTKDGSTISRTINRSAYLLGHLYVDNSEEIANLDLIKENWNNVDYNVVYREYYNRNNLRDYGNPWDYVMYVGDNREEYLVYDISDIIHNEITTSNGILGYYYTKSDSTLLSKAILRYKDNDGNYIYLRSFERYLYYTEEIFDSEKIELLIYNTSSMREKEASSLKIKLEFASYKAFDDFKINQSRYQNQKITINKKGMSIEFDNNDFYHDLVALIPIAYDKGFKVENEKYEIIEAGGGFIGVIIPKTEDTHISFNLNYEPKYLDKSLILSSIGCIIYLAIFGGIHVVKYKIKKKNMEM